jgi:hypothetical protein
MCFSIMRMKAGRVVLWCSSGESIGGWGLSAESGRAAWSGRGKGEGRREKGEGRREKGEGRREKGSRGQQKGQPPFGVRSCRNCTRGLPSFSNYTAFFNRATG